MASKGRKDKARKNKDKQGRPGPEPATVVVDLRLDLRGLTVVAGGVPAALDSAHGSGARHSGAPGAAVQAMAGYPTRLVTDPGSERSGPVGPSWPLGPHYLRWVEGKGADAWARFKLRSAAWYLDALEVAEREVGLDRFVGVEMAIDGVLSSLCAGVDAAGHALLEELERFATPTMLHTHRSVDADWSLLVGVAEGVGIGLGSARALELAVHGDEDDEVGWLTQLAGLRALAVQRNVLVRRPNVDGAARSRVLDVPGLGQRPVLRCLRKVHRRADGLVEAMLADLDGIARERHRRPAHRGVSRPGLDGLSARAGLSPGRHGFETR